MKTKREYIHALRIFLLKKRLGSQNFSIISNNCWGAHIYQHVEIPYQTPFIGTFLTPDCYLKLAANFRDYINKPLTFVPSSRHVHLNAYRTEKELNYPIGLLGEEVEVHFLHYHSQADAIDKWNRRLQRLTKDDNKLYFKLCDHEPCTTDQIAAFDKLPLKNKVCFLARPLQNMKHAVWIPSSQGERVVDGLVLSSISPEYFDAANWIKGGSGKPKWWKRLNIA
jgi:uncharacterized protein (DUF1919 family)